MLEQQQLWLGPWFSPQRPGAAAETSPWSQRLITDPGTDQRLGLARRRPLLGWARWLGRPTLQVLETEDEALLCLLRRSWRLPPAWSVHDAEERFVGSLRGGELFDPFGQCFGMLLEEGRVVAPDTQLLAQLTPSNAGVLLDFTAALGNNPFARMVVLSLALTRD